MKRALFEAEILDYRDNHPRRHNPDEALQYGTLQALVLSVFVTKTGAFLLQKGGS